MNKGELVDTIAAKAELSKAAAGRVLDATLESIMQAVAKNDGVTLVGFGTFRTAKRAARDGRNPRTGEAIKIDAATVPKFTPGAGFRATVAAAKPAKAAKSAKASKAKAP